MGTILRHKAQSNVVRCQHGDACKDCCWDWAGWTNKAGYGRTYFITPSGRLEPYAHRAAWIISHRVDIPPTMAIHHRCDNPACCNPAHLWLGTHMQGMLDRQRRGKGGLIGERLYNSKLTEQKVREIWQMAKSKSWTQKQIAQEIGVSQSTVSHVLNRKVWRHVKI